MRESNIVYQVGRYSVRKVRTGFNVYWDGATHAVVVGYFGRGDTYLARAIARADELHATEKGDEHVPY